MATMRRRDAAVGKLEDTSVSAWVPREVADEVERLIAPRVRTRDEWEADRLRLDELGVPAGLARNLDHALLLVAGSRRHDAVHEWAAQTRTPWRDAVARFLDVEANACRTT